MTRSTPTRAPLPADVEAVGVILERAARHRWSTSLLCDALLDRYWPTLAPGSTTGTADPTLPAATGGTRAASRWSASWRRALLDQLDPVFGRYLHLREQLRVQHGPAPFGDAHCARCTASQTCDRCLTGLRAAWTLRDHAARAVLRVPAAAAAAATASVPTPRANPTRRRRP